MIKEFIEHKLLVNLKSYHLIVFIKDVAKSPP